MISRAGRTTVPPADNRPALRRGRAFTLGELLLGIAILVLLGGVSVIGMRLLSKGEQIQDAADRFVIALRMARTEAAILGRQLRIEFDEETGPAKILIESDPIGAPGEFAPYGACTWDHYLDDERVWVAASRLIGPSAFHTVEADQLEDDEEDLQAVTFYPDGSCDSVRIQLSPRDETDTRQIIVTMDGLNGTITTNVTTTQELEEDTQAQQDG